MRARLPSGGEGSAATGELLFDTLKSDVSETLNIRMIDATDCQDDDRDRRKSTFYAGEYFILVLWGNKNWHPTMKVKKIEIFLV